MLNHPCFISSWHLALFYLLQTLLDFSYCLLYLFSVCQSPVVRLSKVLDWLLSDGSDRFPFDDWGFVADLPLDQG